MDRLREILIDLGLQDVSTFIASGNVLFAADTGDSEGLQKRMEAHIESRLGYEVPVFLRTPAALAEIVSFEPPPAPKESASTTSHYVIFLDSGVPPSLRSALTELNSEMDRFFFDEREVHWLIRGKLSESPLFGPGIDRATRGVRTTMRNITTLRRIVSLGA
jgi:uncharacterized protein (DUF1697 family)